MFEKRLQPAQETAPAAQVEERHSLTIPSPYAGAIPSFCPSRFAGDYLKTVSKIMDGTARIAATKLNLFDQWGIPPLETFPTGRHGEKRPFSNAEIQEMFTEVLIQLNLIDHPRVLEEQKELSGVLTPYTKDIGSPFKLASVAPWLLYYDVLAKHIISSEFSTARLIVVARDGLVLSFSNFFDTSENAHSKAPNALYFPGMGIFNRHARLNRSQSRMRKTHEQILSATAQFLLEATSKNETASDGLNKNTIIQQKFVEKFNRWLDQSRHIEVFLGSFLDPQISALNFDSAPVVLFDAVASGKTALILAAWIVRRHPEIDVQVLLGHAKGGAGERLADVGSLCDLGRPAFSIVHEPSWPIEIADFNSKTGEAQFSAVEKSKSGMRGSNTLNWLMCVVAAYNRSAIGNEASILSAIRADDITAYNTICEFTDKRLLHEYIFPA